VQDSIGVEDSVEVSLRSFFFSSFLSRSLETASPANRTNTTGTYPLLLSISPPPPRLADILPISHSVNSTSSSSRPSSPPRNPPSLLTRNYSSSSYYSYDLQHQPRCINTVSGRAGKGYLDSISTTCCRFSSLSPLAPRSSSSHFTLLNSHYHLSNYKWA